MLVTEAFLHLTLLVRADPTSLQDLVQLCQEHIGEHCAHRHKMACCVQWQKHNETGKLETYFIREGKGADNALCAALAWFACVCILVCSIIHLLCTQQQ